MGHAVSLWWLTQHSTTWVHGTLIQCMVLGVVHWYMVHLYGAWCMVWYTGTWYTDIRSMVHCYTVQWYMVGYTGTLVHCYILIYGAWYTAIRYSGRWCGTLVHWYMAIRYNGELLYGTQVLGSTNSGVPGCGTAWWYSVQYHEVWYCNVGGPHVTCGMCCVVHAYMLCRSRGAGSRGGGVVLLSTKCECVCVWLAG